MSVDQPLLRLIHTADVHLGDDYEPSRRFQGFRGVIEAALASKAHALLVVGDLFDNARVKQPHIDEAIEQLARLSIPVVITPGNHDSLDANSIYRRVQLSQAGRHVRLLDEPNGQQLLLDDLHLAIWGRGLVDHHPGHRPLEGFRPAGNGYWQVAMAHGHFVPQSEQSDRSSPILHEEIAGLSCHYLALGHWHRFLDCSVSGVPAFYPGSPSEPGGSFPSCNLVTLDPASGARVERVPL